MTMTEERIEVRYVCPNGCSWSYVSPVAITGVSHPCPKAKDVKHRQTVGVEVRA